MNTKLLVTALAASFTATAFASPTDNHPLSLQLIGRHHTGSFNEGAAEIVAYDPDNRRIFKVNAQAATVDVLDIKNPNEPTLTATIDVSPLGANANSVAVKNGLVAVAIESTDKQAPGTVAFYHAKTLALIHKVTVGALPDMLTFTPDGRYVLVANEGEPSDDYSTDPEGSVSVIDLKRGVKKAKVKNAGFTAFIGKEAALRAQGIRLFGPNANAAQDLEPEYITVDADSKMAWVSLQEANALAVVDIDKAAVVSLLPLGTKDHRLPANALDASDRDSAINIAAWPVRGMYMPDAVNSFQFKGETYIVTANEGDSRDYDGFSEESRVRDLPLDPTAFPNADVLKSNANLGRLTVTSADGDTDNDGDFDELHVFGGRSFSIRNAKGGLVYDSGSDFERIVADRLPTEFNSNNDENQTLDNRSDNKGPEPEGLALGRIRGRLYAFIGLERVGGIMVYDITDPHRVEFVDYVNSRNFSVAARLADGSTNPEVGDLGPEGLTFIPKQFSPNGKPLLVVGNEVSGTTAIFQIDINR